MRSCKIGIHRNYCVIKVVNQQLFHGHHVSSNVPIKMPFNDHCFACPAVYVFQQWHLCDSHTVSTNQLVKVSEELQLSRHVDVVLIRNHEEQQVHLKTSHFAGVDMERMYFCLRLKRDCGKNERSLSDVRRLLHQSNCKHCNLICQS